MHILLKWFINTLAVLIAAYVLVSESQSFTPNIKNHHMDGLKVDMNV